MNTWGVTLPVYYCPPEVQTKRNGLERKKRRLQVYSDWRVLDGEAQGRHIRNE